VRSGGARLSVLLDRRGQTAGVPAAVGDALEAELEPVFTSLEEIEIAWNSKPARGSQTAYRTRTAAVARMITAINAISLARSRRPLTR
jgi:hypothetical protein